MKNKGFTLVELLGVLVILVVVSLIATPIIYTNIENVRLQANKRNTDKLIKTALDYYEKNVMKNEKNEELIIECDGSKCFYEDNQSQELTFSGAKPKGHITISKYGEVLQVDLLFDRYVCSYIDGSIECQKPDLVIDNVDNFNTFLSNANEYNNKVVVLSSDLDYNNKTFTQYTKTFKGEFNALGYSISNITYTGAYHGIFYIIDGATIKSLKVEKSVFTINANTDNIGTIVGIAQNNSKIYNCYSIDNTITSESSISNTGGISGTLSSSNIYNCHALRIKITSSIGTNNNYHGGIVGNGENNSKINNSNILDSYINGYDNVGGIVGKFAGNINNSYTKNVLINGNNNIGGLVGVTSNTCSIMNSYVSYDSSNSDIIKIIKENNVTGDNDIPSINGNINKTETVASGIVGYINTSSSLTLNNIYVKNVIFNNKNNTTGYLIGSIGSNSTLSINKAYALSPLIISASDEYLGDINSATTTNTIIFNYDDAIAYKSSDINSISDWKNNLDKNWNTTSSKYPLLYKIDKNGNPTSYLLGGQE